MTKMRKKNITPGIGKDIEQLILYHPAGDM